MKIRPDLLDFSLTLTPADRIRQANAAFRLVHQLHRPYARPRLRGFDTLEEFFRHEKVRRRWLT